MLSNYSIGRIHDRFSEFVVAWDVFYMQFLL